MSDQKTLSHQRGKAQSYRDLLVWQKGVALVKLIYEFTSDLPTEEKFGLISQMRRAAVSIPSNLAEGQARRSTREFIQFASNAEGSAAELDTQVVVCVLLGHKTEEKAKAPFEAIAEVRRMLNALRRALSARI